MPRRKKQPETTGLKPGDQTNLGPPCPWCGERSKTYVQTLEGWKVGFFLCSSCDKKQRIETDVEGLQGAEKPAEPSLKAS